MSRADPLEPGNRRRPLALQAGLVAEEFIALPQLPPKGSNHTRQITIPFAGAFEFQVGSWRKWVDPSRLLFTSANEDFVDHHVLPNTGHAIIVLTPDEATLDVASGGNDAAFRDRLRACPPNLQLMAQRLRRASESLDADELAFHTLICAFRDTLPLAARDTRCVRRAKEYLLEHEEPRVTLKEVAEAVGVTPIHLTTVFRYSEGIPLYRYQLQLRLGRALVKLPEQEDITDLALELGFSSHSHFTSAFRSAFGLTPSQYRSGVYC